MHLPLHPPCPPPPAPARDSSSGHPPSPARLLARGPATTPVTLATLGSHQCPVSVPPSLPAPHSPSLLPGSHQSPILPCCAPGPAGAPLTSPAPPRCAQLTLPAPSLRPGPRGSWSSRSGFVSCRKATQLTFPVRRARHPRPESKHGRKAAVWPAAAAPHPAHVLRPGEGKSSAWVANADFAAIGN